MWSFLGIALALLVQTLQTNPQIENSLANTVHLNAPQAIISPTPFKQRIAKRFVEIQPTPTQNQAQEQIALKPQPSATQTNNNESSDQAYNNRSNNVIESVSPQAIEHSPALDPCTPSTCPSPTPKPSRPVEPTHMPIPSTTPFPTPLVTVIPLPTIINEPPRCPSIPPHYDKMGPERPLVADPIYCLD
jgi:hypothetical protein